MTIFGGSGRFGAIAGLLASLSASNPVWSGTQAEEHLAPSVRAGLTRAISDAPIPANYENRSELLPWLAQMSQQLASKVPDERERRALLATVHYEATRAGLDPQLVLSVMYHESGFKKYAVSFAGARGYMQVMPFWVKQIGTPDQNLFHLRTNLRYGMVILRHYLAIENGDLYRALGRYNGSLGRAEYPTAVLAAYNRRFQYIPTVPPAVVTFATAASR
ncbi:MAG: lytic transglycosylase domain-containing protein [Betaproteobacteria bacterium]|nr:lytic transglycosylase domain-containing protein [Betaproteobacteria bacterium]